VTSFDAGPHVSCYRGVSRADGSFTGVRCVKFANLVHCPDIPGVAFVWYAEGPGPSRHFGEAFIAADGELVAHAAPIVGNGERDGEFLRLRFTGSPEKLTVTGDLDEVWTLVPDGVVPGYRPVARHIERTGPHLTEYQVRKVDGSPGFGVRAMLSSGSWLGAGRWLDLTYLHLGTYIGDPAGQVRFSASDIAATNFFCGLVPWGELTMRPDTAGDMRVTGVWSEMWQQRHAATGWQADPAIAGLSVTG
jgi:hypothetical protein